MKLEADIAVGALQREPLCPQHDGLALRLLLRLLVIFRLQAAADHELVQLRDVRLGGGKLGHDRAVLHDIDAVGELQHLVEPVRDEDERGARLQRAHPAEQDLDVGAFQHRGRLVEQDHEMALGALLQRQRLGELDHLPGGEIELGGARARVDVDLHLGDLAARRGIERAPADDPEAGELRLVAEIDVLADGQVGEQRLLLEHHADALAHRVGGAGRAAPSGRRAGYRRNPADRRRRARASASTCRRRSRRPGRPPRSGGSRATRPSAHARPESASRHGEAPGAAALI